MKNILIILIVYNIVSGQIIEPIETVHIDPNPVAQNQTIKLSLPDSSAFKTDLTTARRMVTTGVVLWVTGINLQLLSLPLFVEKKTYGTGQFLLTIGLTSEVLSPVVSCLGSNKTWDTVIKYNQGFEKHQGWKFYKTGWIFTGCQAAAIITGMLSSVNAHNSEAATIVSACSFGLGSILGIAAHVSFGRSLFVSKRYTKNVLSEVDRLHN